MEHDFIDPLNAIFEDALDARGVAFEREDADTYRIATAEGGLSVSLSNIRRDADRDGDPSAVAHFADRILAIRDQGLPSWGDARSFIFLSAQPSDLDARDALRVPISETLFEVVTLSDAEENSLQFVTPSMCTRWGVDESEVFAAAADNQTRLLDGVTLEVANHEGHKLAMVPLDSVFKASVIFASGFRALVESNLGWPVLAVIPCRDFIYVLEDRSPLVQRIGHVVVREFLGSGYPITTEVLRISDDGIVAIGRYPT